MSVLAGLKALLLGGGDYLIQRSVRLRSSASAYFNRTPASAGNRKTWTWSAWVKRGTLGVSQYLFAAGTGGTDVTQNGLNFQADDTLRWTATGTIYRVSTQVFRDPSAWYHIVLQFDTTQATANDRIRLYVNGTQITAFSTLNNPTQNLDYAVNQAAVHEIGRWTGTSNYFDGYLTEINFIDGQALTPSSFGEIDSTTGVWKPKAYNGTYGTNGFFLKFADNSGSTATTIGKDSSGNGNNWTPNNISVTAGVTYDSMLDVPTLTSETNANFPVLNVIAGLGNGTYSDGNLAYLNGVSATWKSGVASMGATSGKYYFEYTVTAVSSSSNFYLGVAGSTYNGFASYLGRTSDSWAFQWNGASSVKTNNDVSTTVSTAGSISVNNVIQVAIDLGTGSIWWGRNNTWVQGDPSAGTGASYTNLTGTILPAFAVYSNGGDKIAANFGQRPFSYTPPTGFKALNTFNLPDATIPNGKKFFNAVTYTGNTSGGSVSGVGFQPDFIWTKNRSAVSNHELIDAVRGGSSALFSNLTNAEATQQRISSFDVDGWSYTVNSNSALANSFVGWQWNAGGNTVSNTSGSITSSVRANPTAGFSVVTATLPSFTNGTIGHGLGATPDMIIAFARAAAGDTHWVWHKALASTEYLALQTTAAKATSSNVWNGRNSTTFTLGASAGTWGTGNYVFYCFAEVAGFSKFGSYTGNGAADGVFVYTGFRPRFVLIKSSSMAGTRWELFDTSRSTINPSNERLSPNESTAEVTGYNSPDFLSNGFKLRGASGYTNDSGVSYIYAAFAENPFKNALAR